MLLKEIAGQDGTYVAVLPNVATRMLLKQWAAENLLELVDDLHVTLLFSRKPISVTPSAADYPSVPLKFDHLGGDFVLCLDSEALQRRHAELVKAGGSHDFGEYIPHVTLIKDTKVDFSSLKLPNFGLTFTREYTEPLDLDSP